MAIKLTFDNTNPKKNCLLFCDNQFRTIGLNKYFGPKIIENINKSIIKNKSNNTEFLVFNINPEQKIVVAKID